MKPDVKIKQSIERLNQDRQKLKGAVSQLKALRVLLKTEIGTRAIARLTPLQELKDMEKHTRERTIQIISEIISDLGIGEHFGIINHKISKPTKTKSTELLI